MTLVTTNQPCGFARRLAAVGYDAILLFAVGYVATIPILVIHGGRAIEPGDPWYSTYLLAIGYAYFVWQWCRGGQTLGMKAWRIRLRDVAGGQVGWGRASLRFFAALGSWGCAGLGYFWCLFNRNRLAWHDYGSGTRLMLVVAVADEGALSPASGDPTQQNESGDNDQQSRGHHADHRIEIEDHAEVAGGLVNDVKHNPHQ